MHHLIKLAQGSVNCFNNLFVGCNFFFKYRRPLVKLNEYRYIFELQRCLGKSVNLIFHDDVFDMYTKKYWCRRRPEVLRSVHFLLEEKIEFEECSRRNGDNLEFKSAADYLRIVEKCIKVTSGISKQYVYRSMYAAQIARCTGYISLRNMLFINSNDMKRNITSVIERVSIMSKILHSKTFFLNFSK